MFGVNTVRPNRCTIAHRRPRAATGGAVLPRVDGRQRMIPLYHWLGADADGA